MSETMDNSKSRIADCAAEDPPPPTPETAETAPEQAAVVKGSNTSLASLNGEGAFTVRQPSRSPEQQEALSPPLATETPPCVRMAINVAQQAQTNA